MRGFTWTPEELAILYTYYKAEGGKIRARLPGRTRFAILSQAKAHKLLTFTGPVKPWTKAEDKILREFYPAEGSKIIARLKNRTAKACQERASVMNIQFTKRARTTPIGERRMKRLADIPYDPEADEVDCQPIVQRVVPAGECAVPRGMIRSIFEMAEAL